MFDVNTFLCQELKKYPSIGGHISTCSICYELLGDTYNSWRGIIKRVMRSRPGSRDYTSYIKKGITLPKSWIESFFNFLNDVGIKPTSKHFLRRIDRWLDYSKENCRWYLLNGDIDKGLSVKWKTPEYRAHDALKQRCLNPNHESFKDYGGRKENPIGVCDRWLGLDGYKNFISDMGLRPSPKHTIDRKDNNGDYEPSNCEWKLMKDQARNRRSNQWIEFNGKKMTIIEVHEITGISKPALYRRYHSGLIGTDLVAPTRSYIKSNKSSSI